MFGQTKKMAYICIMKKIILTFISLPIIIGLYGQSIEKSPSKIDEPNKVIADTAYYSSYEIKYKNGMFQIVHYPYKDNVYENVGKEYSNMIESIDTLQYKVGWEELDSYWSKENP